MTIRHIILRIALICALLVIGKSSYSESSQPEIHGTVRPRFEWEPSIGMSRFQVRNARFMVSGNVAEKFSYQLQLDLCDRGKVKILDAFGGYSFGKGFKLMAGQMLQPFTLDGPRAPHLLLFANKSLIATQIGNPRAVGVKLRYDCREAPIFAEGGVFNSRSIVDHEIWEKDYTYVGRVGVNVPHFKSEIGVETASPDGLRLARYDVSAQWSNSHWIVEAEYMLTKYAKDSFHDSHGYAMSAFYKIPIKLASFNRLSFQARWDGINDTSNGILDEDGHLYANFLKHNRLTLGSTISCLVNNIRCDFRLNYEFMFYPAQTVIPESDHSKLIAEFVVRF